VAVWHPRSPPQQGFRDFEPIYRPFRLPKRRGGTRQILAPSLETKHLQRRILRRLLGKLRVHPAATGFQPHCSVVHNAQPHVGQAIVIKRDIREFFAHTRSDRIRRYFRHIGWNGEAAGWLTRICCHEGGLPQGAPTSPRLSNLVNYGLDCRIVRLLNVPGLGRQDPKTGIANRLSPEAWAAKRLTYTRYADDMTFSAAVDDRSLQGRLSALPALLDDFGYCLHGGKARVYRRHQQQRVTGLVINDAVALPRRTRRWLRSVRHHHATGRDATLSPQQLAGWDSFQAMVETQTESLGRDG